MPSILLGNQSGGQNILSGINWSGRAGNIVMGGVQLLLHPASSGGAYVGLSGGVTINSGGLTMASGMLDGMLIAPGNSYFVPKIGIGTGNNPQIFVATDAAASGQARLYCEFF